MVDVKDQVLGRISTRVAKLLMGKHKADWVPHLDSGDNVVVINAAEVKVTGKKEKKKKYYRHSGYPGGLKMEVLAELKKRKPTEVVRKAVWNMLPKNKLRKGRMARLFIYAGEKHPHKEEFQKL